MQRIIITGMILLMTLPFALEAQQENKLIRQGNNHYEEGEYKEAEIDYLKSLETKKASHRGLYNLGDALYMQGNYLQATAAFDSLRTMKMDDNTRSEAYYNLGNSLLKLAIDSSQLASEALPGSINAYKQSLRLNPRDMDAKYNLAYAQKLLQDQQQQQDQKQDQQQDQQKQDQQQDQQQDQKQDQQQDQQQQDEQQQQNRQQQQPQEISKEDAQRILEALKNDEKQTLEKLKQAQLKNMRVIKSEKDW